MREKVFCLFLGFFGFFFFLKKNQPTIFPLNTTTTGTKTEVTFFECYKQPLLCREEMQTGLEIVCGARGEKGDYPQDLLFVLPDAWQSKLLQNEEILI